MKQQAEILIANIKPFQKVNDDGSTWNANIIDGLIFGIGCINQFVPVSKIKGTIKEGSQYSCVLSIITRGNRLAVDLEIQGE